MRALIQWAETADGGALLVFGGLACAVLLLLREIQHFRAERAIFKKWEDE